MRLTHKYPTPPNIPVVCVSVYAVFYCAHILIWQILFWVKCDGEFIATTASTRCVCVLVLYFSTMPKRWGKRHRLLSNGMEFWMWFLIFFFVKWNRNNRSRLEWVHWAQLSIASRWALWTPNSFSPISLHHCLSIVCNVLIKFACYIHSVVEHWKLCNLCNLAL